MGVGRSMDTGDPCKDMRNVKLTGDYMIVECAAEDNPKKRKKREHA